MILPRLRMRLPEGQIELRMRFPEAQILRPPEAQNGLILRHMRRRTSPLEMAPEQVIFKGGGKEGKA